MTDYTIPVSQSCDSGWHRYCKPMGNPADLLCECHCHDDWD